MHGYSVSYTTVCATHVVMPKWGPGFLASLYTAVPKASAPVWGCCISCSFACMVGNKHLSHECGVEFLVGRLMHVCLACGGIAALSPGSVYVHRFLSMRVFTAMHLAVYAVMVHMLQVKSCGSL
jgi:hypothetical protein